jgi:hypothetical protein
MDYKRVMSDPMSRDITSSGGEFNFQSKTRGQWFMRLYLGL